MSGRLMICLVLFFSLMQFPASTAQTACSGGGTGSTTVIKVVNYSRTPIRVYWLNFECVEVLYSTVIPGTTFEQPTYDQHQWIIRAENESEIGRLTASESELRTLVIGKEPRVVEITSPLDFSYRPASAFSLPVDSSACQVSAVTPDMGLDPFYSKHCNYEGILIISSSNVPDKALQAAWTITATMLSPHPQVVQVMLDNKVRIGIVAAAEGITDLPEYRFLKDDPEINWDARARGLGASTGVPLVSGAEENLLCYPIDGYLGENIYVHELAHTLKDVGIALVDPQFNTALQIAYDQAAAAGLWQNTYALTNRDEYWAEGVQSYFNTNLEADPANGIHNAVDTREELRDYDPTLYSMIDTVFGGLEWTPTCP